MNNNYNYTIHIMDYDGCGSDLENRNSPLLKYIQSKSINNQTSFMSFSARQSPNLDRHCSERNKNGESFQVYDTVCRDNQWHYDRFLLPDGLHGLMPGSTMLGKQKRRQCKNSARMERWRREGQELLYKISECQLALRSIKKQGKNGTRKSQEKKLCNLNSRLDALNKKIDSYLDGKKEYFPGEKYHDFGSDALQFTYYANKISLFKHQIQHIEKHYINNKQYENDSQFTVYVYDDRPELLRNAHEWLVKNSGSVSHCIKVHFMHYATYGNQKHQQPREILSCQYDESIKRSWYPGQYGGKLMGYFLLDIICSPVSFVTLFTSKTSFISLMLNKNFKVKEKEYFSRKKDGHHMGSRSAKCLPITRHKTRSHCFDSPNVTFHSNNNKSHNRDDSNIHHTQQNNHNHNTSDNNVQNTPKP